MEKPPLITEHITTSGEPFDAGIPFSQKNLERFRNKINRSAGKNLLDAPIDQDEAYGIIDAFAQTEEPASEVVEIERLLLLFEGKSMSKVAQETGSSKSAIARLEDDAADAVAKRLKDLFYPSKARPSQNPLQKKPEYDPFATPMIDSRDGVWLTALMQRPPSVDFFKVANNLINSGSDMYSGNGPLQGTLLERNLEARTNFFMMLGWADDEHPLNASFQEALQGYGGHRRLPPLGNFVFLQRSLLLHGVNPLLLMKEKPTSMFYDPEVILPRLKKLKELNINLAKLSKEQLPLLVSLIERQTDSIDKITGVLERKGINVNSVVQRCPQLLKRSDLELKRRIDSLNKLGIDHITAVNRRPEILDISSERVKDVTVTLEGLGLNAQQVVNKCPALLLFKTETLEKKMEALEAFMPNAKELIQTRPQLLESDPRSVYRKFNILNRLAQQLKWQGDINELIYERPEVLQAADSKLFFLAATAGSHLDERARSIPVATVASAIALPVASHLLAASRETQSYSITLARRYNREMKPAAREFAAKKALQDFDTRQRIGEKAVRAYIRHVSKR